MRWGMNNSFCQENKEQKEKVDIDKSVNNKIKPYYYLIQRSRKTEQGKRI